MNEITIKQNLQEQIDKLAAQRCLYSKAKNIFYCRILFSLIFAIVMPLLARFLGNYWYHVALVVVFYFIIDIFILERIEDSYKKDAAKIQESFDVEVFNLKWNDVVVGNKIDEEYILKYSDLYKKNNKVDDLLNWYSEEVSKIDLIPAIAVCQRTNIFWDISLRITVFWTIIITLIAAIFVVFVCSKNPVLILLSLLPFYRVMADYCKSQKSTIESIKSLKNKIEGFLNESSNFTIEKISYLRSVQDEIFRHRKNSAFVPDKLYWLNRSKQEKEMNYSAKNYVDRILKNQN